jgi:hypothetical protein
VGGDIVFWPLLFAHFLADYPLQTNWIVINKNRPLVLLLHVSIHFLVSLVLVIIYLPGAWPFLVLLIGIHFLIDTGKNFVNKSMPNWVVIPYFIDQFLHLISIFIVATLIASFSNIPLYAFQPLWLIVSIAYLVVTYVWYISERIITFQHRAYFEQVVDSEWSRMLARAVFLTLPLLAWTNFTNLIGIGVLVFPYKKQNFGIRALMTDILIAGCGAFFIVGIVG